MFGNLSGPTLLVILFIVLLLFGAPKLPALARSLGQSMRILKKEVTTDESPSGSPDADVTDRPNSTTTNDSVDSSTVEKRKGGSSDTPSSGTSGS